MLGEYDYTPFLKFKVNEVSGLSVLHPSLVKELTPFLDLPRRDGLTRVGYERLVDACRKKADKYLAKFPALYLDTFDIPDAIAIPGSPNCRVLIDAFSGFLFVPVLGLDRAADHNTEIIKAKAAGELISDTVAVRFQYDEFSSFELIEDDLRELVGEAEVFDKTVFVLDCRICLNSSPAKLAKSVADFVTAAAATFDVYKFIVTGSSIPSSISDVAKPSGESIIPRVELDVYHSAQALVPTHFLSLGDYTVVSPAYSDLDIAPELLLGVTAPKVFYSFDNAHYIARGRRIKTDGYQQYDLIFEQLVRKSFYRGEDYSWGDEFIMKRAAGFRERNVTPSVVLKPTICSHITFMAYGY